MKNKIEVGQTVYVSVVSMFTKSERGVTPYRVTRVNTKSFYAVSLDTRRSSDLEYRFDLRTKIHRTGFGYNYIAYLSEDSYWSMIKRSDEKADLIKKISEKIPTLSLKELNSVKDILKI